MREKRVYRYSPHPHSTGHILRAILTLSGLNDVFLQPLVPFLGLSEIAPRLGDQILQKHFGA